MSISFLITGGNKKSREEAVARKLADHPFTLTPQGYSIEDIRNLQREINRRPAFGSVKAAIISEAQNLTPEAQNSLLKTLEEPPGETIMILTCPNSDLLLPTIVSRCRVISLPPLPEIELSSAQIAELKKTDIKNISTREEALDYIEKLIFIAQKELLENKIEASFVRKLLKTRHYLQSNTNIKLTLENLFL